MQQGFLTKLTKVMHDVVVWYQTNNGYYLSFEKV
jgi:hypothetical protein